MNLDIDYLLATIGALHLTISQLRADLKEALERSKTDAEVERPARKSKPAPAHPSTDAE